MPENGQSGSEGGGAGNRSPYPYYQPGPTAQEPSPKAPGGLKARPHRRARMTSTVANPFPCPMNRAVGASGAKSGQDLGRWPRLV